MRKKISISVGIGLGLIVLGLAIFWPRDEGPIFNGKPVAYWLAQWNQIGNSGGSTIPKFDSNAIPYLVSTLERHDSKIRRRYIDSYEKFPVWLKHITPELIPKEIVKENAILALWRMGPEAKPAVNSLVQCIKKEENETGVRLTAIRAIEFVGASDKEIRDALVAASGSSNPVVSTFAGNTLARRGTDGPF